MFLNSFIKTKQVELKAFGIKINLKSAGTLIERYSNATGQIKKLDPIRRYLEGAVQPRPKGREA
jgi:hypothetical protein